MQPRHGVRPPLLCALILLMPVCAGAQETRAATIAAAQAEKATRLAPEERSWAEQLVLTARQVMVVQPSGFYPYFDSVYSGGGFTLGAGYRQFTGDRTHWNVAGLYSATGYKLIEAGTTSPGHWGGRLDLHAAAGWRDATQVAYHGLGIESPEDAGTAFRMQQGYAGADATARPRSWILLTAGASYEDYTIKDPTGNFTPVDAVYDSAQAPGVGANPAFLHTTVSAAIDSRPAADYTRRGGLYQISRHDYVDREAFYSFSRLDLEAVQHVPILRENWVISLHGRLAVHTR